MDEPVAAPGRSPWRTGVKLATVVAVLALIALLVWATLATGKGRNLVSRVAAGERPAAPSFVLEVIWPRTDTWPVAVAGAVADGTLSLEQLRGVPVVLNFWASWCIPCREEAPILNAAARAQAGKIAFLGIDVQDLRSDALAFLGEFDVPYVSLRESDNETFNAYGLTGVPETYLLDADGRIIVHIPGPLTQESLAAAIATATTTPSTQTSPQP